MTSAPRRRGTALLATLGVLAAGVGLALTAPVPPAIAADGPDCLQVGADAAGQTPVTGVNEASAALGVPAADAALARAGRRPGEGVTVVVVDTPVGDLAAGAVATAPDPHGLIAASIVAGPAQPEPPVAVGIAPAARVVERPFYLAPTGRGSEGQPGPTASALAPVLRQVADDVRASRLGPRTVVLVPTEVAGAPGLEAAVDAVVEAGALVVAAAGDRPQEGGGFLADFAGGPRPGEDAAAVVWPAADPRVVAVGVSLRDQQGRVLRSSAIDLGAPGAGAVARAADGRWCVVGEASTHWAAAQVAGVAALAWSAHPDDDASTLRRRLESTAAGSAAPSSRAFGFGEVQPSEAVERPLPPAASAPESREVVRRAGPPRARVDLLGSGREDAVRWGIAGGAAVVVLLLVRPVLSRRRR